MSQLWSCIMKVYLAAYFTTMGGYYEKYCDSTKGVEKRHLSDVYLLSSYHELCNNSYDEKVIRGDKHIFDSGAFSAMVGTIQNVDWDKYVEGYINFINKYKIKLFFELDIDSLVGLERVEKIRKKIEKDTNIQSIPVWHKARGKDKWREICDSHDYCAIGGIVTREIKPSEYNIIIGWCLKEADKRNCKVHGLGFTRSVLFNRFPFYSVDSSTWTNGGRYANLYKFDRANGLILYEVIKKKGYRVNKRKYLDVYNFHQWIDFQRYAEKYY
ncbi:MAG: hypothetical protein OMM_01327 [Candidatus Magnetoglobus multicellularis str. Araruama]|uniref:Uncharacterized protein n=1 Tax=Candidatus Magnetoglobus multicellularis str. Araruama TaxID=890399 RepID=A0A1V1PDJ4_9BACT|nr:MAG: hypothetical protein OMM_01327 [Candidatus Magnetoglobus multicellularis str. Araruama]